MKVGGKMVCLKFINDILILKLRKLQLILLIL